MKYSKQQLWQRFQQRYTEFPELELAVDLSRMDYPDGFFAGMQAQTEKAFADMTALEGGAIANPDEKRMVGHYWLRNPAIAPKEEVRGKKEKEAIIGRGIEQTLRDVKGFAAQVHAGVVCGAGGKFVQVLLIGIGGSALGPQFVANALGCPRKDKMALFFFDNTDPDGMDRVLAQIGSKLNQTLTIVISKSGGTKETRNGMLEARAAYEAAGLNFGFHAVAITQQGSELDNYATENRWLRRFPMWDWVGGRTSELSAVGLLPAALQGLDIDAMLAGAKACDEVTRRREVKQNPAMQMALMWHYAGNGKGTKNMVVLPYKDRLELLSKYLQQLIMESLGKAEDLDKKLVNQGITVLGNKGSTDQHSYIQQLRDGLGNFFVTFIEVLRDRQHTSMTVEPDVTAGDYLEGFLLGTRFALFDNGRESITLTVKEVSPFTVGVLIALFERAVGFYASLIHINAYHQPGVEAGKKAASAVIELQTRIVSQLRYLAPRALTPSEIAEAVGSPDEVESVFKICEHLAANPDRGVRKEKGASVTEPRYHC